MHTPLHKCMSFFVFQGIRVIECMHFYVGFATSNIKVLVKFEYKQVKRDTQLHKCSYFYPSPFRSCYKSM